MRIVIFVTVSVLILLLIGGGVYVVSRALQTEETEVAINTTTEQSTNRSEEAPRTDVAALTLPQDFPPDVFLPDAALETVARTGAGTRIGFSTTTNGPEVQEALRTYMTGHGWSEEYTLSSDQTEYTGDWTKDNRAVEIFLAALAEDRTLIQITY